MANVDKKYLEEYKKRAKELVSKLTQEEKGPLMIHNSEAVERLGIKEYNWWNEALHGVARAGTATVFPQAIGLAAMFDEEKMYQVADIISTEGRAKYNVQASVGDRDLYKGLTFWAPNINIFRDPRWGRGQETYGEDPYLTSRLGIAFINGIQGNDKKYLKAAACVKHFAVHSGPERLRHVFDANISKKDLYETYLEAFHNCITDAKVEGVMGAYNSLYGLPCCGNKYLLTDILRNKWNFDGYVTSDCWAVRDFHTTYNITENAEESLKMSTEAGCELVCECATSNMIDAIKKGIVDEKVVDKCLIDLFITRMKLGEFDLPENNPFSKISYLEVDTPKSRKFNREVSRESIVLLKNDGILPIDKSKVKTIGVIGPNADSRVVLVGNYEGTSSHYQTVLQGIEDAVENDGVRVLYSSGSDIYNSKRVWGVKENDGASEIKAVCAESDLVIVVGGIDRTLEGEEGNDAKNSRACGDKVDICIPQIQQELLKEVKASGKPCVFVCLSGSALDLRYVNENYNAVLEGWYPGAEGGNAIADVLFGDFSPEGRLPITFYNSDEDLNDFENYSMKGRTYRYLTKKPLYPFGYGLSYTSFDFNLKNVSANQINGDGIDITLEITNSGKFAGGTTAQVYVKSEKKDTPNYSLKGLKKVFLNIGETKTITVHLDTKAFALWNDDGEFAIEKGNFKVFVGETQPDERSFELTGKKSIEIDVVNTEKKVLDLMV